ncbi:hypothetical protein NFI96_011925 [Prochilodus magdalenae]|nr:hypothetical protein NFI96_011925 [Prochilodus magdalenae]
MLGIQIKDLFSSLLQIITQYVYERLEKDCKLRKEMLPVDATEDEPTSFIYLSEDALTNTEKLLVLIQGSGVVRAGQWARRLIINEDLYSGTQIPFIKRAMKMLYPTSTDIICLILLSPCGLSPLEGYGVIVLNPNENFLEVEKVPDAEQSAPDTSDEPAEKRERKEEREGKKKKDFYEKYRNPQREKETERIPIRENSSPEEHMLYVWDHFISKSLAKNIFVVAHSYGGLSFVELAAYGAAEVQTVSSSIPKPQPLRTPLLTFDHIMGSFFYILLHFPFVVSLPFSSPHLFLRPDAQVQKREGLFTFEGLADRIILDIKILHLNLIQMIQREEDVKPRVTAVAMTDSVHNVWHQEAKRSIQEWLKERCCNWVSSSEPLDTPVDPMLPDCLRLSAALVGYLQCYELKEVNLRSFKNLFNESLLNVLTLLSLRPSTVPVSSLGKFLHTPCPNRQGCASVHRVEGNAVEQAGRPAGADWAGPLVGCQDSREALGGSGCSGTERHELTSWKSFQSIFKFFDKHLEQQMEEDVDEEESSATVTTRSSNKPKHEDL